MPYNMSTPTPASFHSTVYRRHTNAVYALLHLKHSNVLAASYSHTEPKPHHGVYCTDLSHIICAASFYLMSASEGGMEGRKINRNQSEKTVKIMYIPSANATPPSAARIICTASVQRLWRNQKRPIYATLTKPYGRATYAARVIEPSTTPKHAANKRRTQQTQQHTRSTATRLMCSITHVLQTGTV